MTSAIRRKLSLASSLRYWRRNERLTRIRNGCTYNKLSWKDFSSLTKRKLIGSSKRSGRRILMTS